MFGHRFTSRTALGKSALPVTAETHRRRSRGGVRLRREDVGIVGTDEAFFDYRRDRLDAFHNLGFGIDRHDDARPFIRYAEQATAMDLSTCPETGDSAERSCAVQPAPAQEANDEHVELYLITGLNPYKIGLSDAV